MPTATRDEEMQQAIASSQALRNYMHVYVYLYDMSIYAIMNIHIYIYISLEADEDTDVTNSFRRALLRVRGEMLRSSRRTSPRKCFLSSLTGQLLTRSGAAC